MAILRSDEIRKMNNDERQEELDKILMELIRERAIASAGGAPESPGKMKEIKRTIARIRTIQTEKNK
ncbi:MAG: 50S ribosomal protein L29 [Candidatus Methanoperedens nitroreducens]|uniref:Large ribosomal subunit protein uL29 n=1 Tax=Candidatus Methanoperedens nitratireducens TaxID=1392998 RepID=A0A0N8KQS7_9EURY|nr:50S ribosomal protein L29 [Candidatus Methanoperedens sp. BLZ2]KAB2945667.1 MAG: 50S ribosomal protein L29 [Candidatus Methanoperedens sp.]KPQ42970.1 MAG: 50S ribosomal protein L29 [Candidatus Methanoperedens sp. BLZ1]MBZ0177294.1 50S ribosomal protein L29 [Candidatus Methanoperedens nitroreducens]MCX9076828.1 50S ribosomal protein L29 [Candidatus Methanoperedens sp.]MCX9088301.1 50S ribosomal protein L29 [Candidatus Methanoperedens sp.]